MQHATVQRLYSGSTSSAGCFLPIRLRVRLTIHYTYVLLRRVMAMKTHDGPKNYVFLYVYTPYLVSDYCVPPYYYLGTKKRFTATLPSKRSRGYNTYSSRALASEERDYLSDGSPQNSLGAGKWSLMLVKPLP